jgi:hypothetical protein
VVDGVSQRFFLFINPSAPFTDIAGKVRCFWGILSLLAGWVIRVKIDRTAGRMYYHYAHVTRFGNNPIHPRPKLPNPAGRTLTPVLVPHIANNNSSLLRIPF